MRLRNKKTYYLKAKTIIPDSEGGKYESFGNPVEIQANVYPANGKLQAEMYGERLNYINNMLYDGPINMELNENFHVHYISPDRKIDFCEDYGVCVNVPPTVSPDYKIISIKQTGHLFMEIEKI